MAKHLPIILLVVVALTALVAAGPVSPRGNGEHTAERRSLRGFFRRAKQKVKHAGHRVGHAMHGAKRKMQHAGHRFGHALHADVHKLRGCMHRLGLPRQALHIAEGCALSAFAGFPALGLCVATSGAIPAARATAHIAVCMG